VKRRSDRDRASTATLRVWTLTEAQAAAPFLASIVRSIREHALESLTQRRKARRLSDKPGRPSRSALINQQEAEHAAVQAEDRFREAVAELQALDIYCLDPIQGLALVPFVRDEQLAWYIFDLFDSTPFRFWRYQSDPEETRRHTSSLQRG
jgi:hypothetical protein